MLDFPTVTVCPPKGSHTALNYDLIKADNNSLTDEDRKSLTNDVLEIFAKPGHHRYIEYMLATANPENLKQMYYGLQSVPEIHQEPGLKIEMLAWENRGFVQTPYFQEDYTEDYLSQNQNHHYILRLPFLKRRLWEMSNNASLVIQLEVDTREGAVENEYVEYREGFGYTEHNADHMTWVDAEAHCQREGGHLASIHSDDQALELGLLSAGGSYWIGAAYDWGQGAWIWTDGSPWDYSKWAYGFGISGGDRDCVRAYGDGWQDVSCTEVRSFICKSNPIRISGQRNVTFKYTYQQLSLTSFEVWYTHRPNGLEVRKPLEQKRTTGCRLSWFFLDSNGSRLSMEVGEQPEYWDPDDGYLQPLLHKMMQQAHQARMKNMTREDAIEKTLVEKAKLILSETFEYNKMCSGGQVKKSYYKKLFGEIDLGLIVHPSGEKPNISEDDMKTGFMMYSGLIYCSESVALSKFLQGILSSQSPRSIIQATVNTIQSGDIVERADKEGMNLFYQALDKIFQFQLGKILLATASKSEIESMKAKDWPYFFHHSIELEQCLNGTNCHGIHTLIQSLGECCKCKLNT